MSFRKWVLQYLGCSHADQVSGSLLHSVNTGAAADKDKEFYLAARNKDILRKGLVGRGEKGVVQGFQKNEKRWNPMSSFIEFLERSGS